MKRLRNIRQEKFCQEISQGKTQVEAYQDAYPKAQYETAKANASALLNNDKIADRITQILNDKGLTLNNLIGNTLNELLEGKKEVLGTHNTIITLKDNTSKAEGLKIALKLHKALDSTEILQDNRQVNIILDKDSIDRLSSIVNNIRALKDRALKDLL